MALVAASVTKAVKQKPCQVRMKVISATRARLGASAVKRRWTSSPVLPHEGR
jgi:hypothetical protein